MKYQMFFIHFFSLLLASHAIFSDTVYLKNGNVLTGTISEQTSSKIVLQVAFGTLTIPSRQISRIDHDDATDNLIAQGNRLISLGAFEHAVRFYQKAIRKNPKQNELFKAAADACLKAGEHYFEQRKLALAKKYFQKARFYYPDLDISGYLAAIKRKKNWAKQQWKRSNLDLQAGKGRKALVGYYAILKISPEWMEQIAPNFARAAIMEGSRYLHKKDLGKACFYYNLALEFQPKIFPLIEPQWLYAHVQRIIHQYIEKALWKKALNALRKIITISPGNHPSLFLTGIAYEKTGRYAQASAYYGQLIGKKIVWKGNFAKLETLRLQAQKMSGIRFHGDYFFGLPQDQPKGEWHQLSSPPFIIFYQNAKLAKRLQITLHYHLQRIQQRLAPSFWNKKLQHRYKVYLHASKKEYLSVTGTPDWSEGITKTMYLKGKLRIHSIHLYQSAPLLFSSILPHELTHALYPSFVNHQANLPLWLNEGIAMTSEPFFRRQHRRKSFLRSLRHQKIIPLEKLFRIGSYPTQLQKLTLFYAQSYTLVQFLLQQHGKTQLARFAILLRNQTTTQALYSIYRYSTISAFEKHWLNIAKRK